jgi:hypothetical protein
MALNGAGVLDTDGLLLGFLGGFWIAGFAENVGYWIAIFLIGVGAGVFAGVIHDISTTFGRIGRA